MITSPAVSIWAALLAGLASFFSPCVLPLIPVYIGYMTGSVMPDGSASGRLLALRHAAVFVAGFAATFVLLGAAAGGIGRAISSALPVVTRVAGAVLIIFGLQMLGAINLPFLAIERRVVVQHRSAGLWRSLLLGLAFAVGWSPCVGPVLAAIMVLAADTQTMWRGGLLLGVYAMGLGVPFLIAGALVAELTRILSRARRALAVATKVGGLLVSAMGLLMLTGQFQRIALGLLSN